MTSATRDGRLDAARAYADVVRLAGDIGVRVAGTEAEATGAAYLAGQFRQAGLEPWEERFPIPVWRERRATLRVDGVEIPAISPCFGGVTGPEGVVGAVVPVGDPLHAEDLDGADLAGKIALIDGRNVYFDYPDYLQTDLLTAAGVAGLVFAAGAGQQGGLPQAYYNFKRALHQPTPPSVIVGYDDAQRMRADPGLATLVVEAEVEWSESVSVLADLPGSDLAGQIVVVSAHHDTVWTSPGASDNAGGCAAVAELARAFAAGPQPRRTIRFAQWGGHEVGLWGSETWLGRHVDEVGRIAAVVNFDGQGVLNGSDHASVLGSPSWQRLVETALAGTRLPVEVAVGGGGVDSVNFAAVGRNAVNFSRWGEVGNHTPADNLDPIGPAGMESGLRMSAAVLAAVCDGGGLDLGDAAPPEQMRDVQAWCARWGWGIAG